VHFVAICSEPVIDLIGSTGKITLGGTAPGTLSYTVSSYVYDSDANTYSYDIAVSGMTGNGTVTAAIAAGAVHDADLEANTVIASTDASVTYTYTVAPTVTVDPAASQTSPTTKSPINFAVVFSQAVSGFTTANLQQAISGNSSIVSGTAFQFPNGVTVPSGTTSGPTVVVTNPSGDLKTFNVAVSGMVAEGTVTLQIPADLVFNTSGVSNVASTSTKKDNTVTYDIPLTVDIEQGEKLTDPDGKNQADPTNQSPVHFVAKCSEPVVDLVGSSAAVKFSGTATGTLSYTVSSPVYDADTNTYDYDIAVSGMTGDGTIIAAIAAGAVHDASLQANTVIASTDAQVTYSLAPTVTIDAASAQANPATTSPINFTVVFSQKVTDFTAVDVQVSGTAFDGSGYDAVTAAPVVVVTNPSGDGKTWNVAVSGMNADGTVTATIPAGVANTSAGVANLASTSTKSDNTVTYVLPLTVTINQATSQVDPTSKGPIDFTVVFSKPVTSFSSAGVSLTGGTATGATVQQLTSSDGGKTWNLVINGMTDTGTVVVTIPVGVAASSADPTQTNAASTSTDNSVSYVTAPTVTVTAPTAAVKTSRISFNVDFSEPVTGFSADSVTLGGTATGQLSVEVHGTGADLTVVNGVQYQSHYIVTVTGMTSDGTVKITIDAGAATDQASNANTASTTATAQLSSAGSSLVGLYDSASGAFYLDSTNVGSGNTAPAATAVVSWAKSTWLPVTGDWDGNGSSTIGYYDPATSQWYLKNSNDGVALGSGDVASFMFWD
jgi:hypothetical protein